MAQIKGYAQMVRDFQISKIEREIEQLSRTLSTLRAAQTN